MPFAESVTFRIPLAAKLVLKRAISREILLEHTLSPEAPPPAISKVASAESKTARRAAIPLAADIIIANAPDPVFVSDLEGKIIQANDAVSQLLGFRTDEVVEQSVSQFISQEETRQFTAALREVVEKGVIRNVTLSPRTATGEVIPTSLNASALRDSEGKV